MMPRSSCTNHISPKTKRCFAISRWYSNCTRLVSDRMLRWWVGVRMHEVVRYGGIDSGSRPLLATLTIPTVASWMDYAFTLNPLSLKRSHIRLKIQVRYSGSRSFDLLELLLHRTVTCPKSFSSILSLRRVSLLKPPAIAQNFQIAFIAQSLHESLALMYHVFTAWPICFEHLMRTCWKPTIAGNEIVLDRRNPLRFMSLIGLGHVGKWALGQHMMVVPLHLFFSAPVHNSASVSAFATRRTFVLRLMFTSDSTRPTCWGGQVQGSLSTWKAWSAVYQWSMCWVGI